MSATPTPIPRSPCCGAVRRIDDVRGQVDVECPRCGRIHTLGRWVR